MFDPSGYRKRWATFKSWHSESLWREVYARALSSVIAGVTLVALGVLIGLVHVKRRDALAALALLITVLLVREVSFFLRARLRSVGAGWSRPARYAVIAVWVAVVAIGFRYEQRWLK